jgi:hypothetical protein
LCLKFTGSEADSNFVQLAALFSGPRRTHSCLCGPIQFFDCQFSSQGIAM